METDRQRSDTERIRFHLLVVRCQTGDEEAFARLLDRFGPRTLRYLRRLVDDDAEDVHQEVWFRVYRDIGRLAIPAAFVTWLLRTTRHAAIDHLRRRRRAHELLDDIAAESIGQSEAPAMTDAIGLAADDRIDLADLKSAIDALPSLHREVLLLRYQEDLSYEEIAVVVGCSVGTVKSRLHHAKRRLQTSIGAA